MVVVAGNCRQQAASRIFSRAEMLTTNAEDEAIRNACRVAGVDFYEVTDRFREESVHEQFFFELDGHFNPAG